MRDAGLDKLGSVVMGLRCGSQRFAESGIRIDYDGEKDSSMSS